MITRLDRTVGRLLDLLAELGLEENTLVLFTSDNGPADDAGGMDHAFFNSAGPLRGLKGSVYEGGLRVPLLARWPGAIKPGVSDHISYFPDLLPTLLDVAGSPERIPKDVDGTSFAATLRGQRDRQKAAAFLLWEFAGYGGQQAVRMGDWKGVRQKLHKGQTAIELYNLKEDLGEKNDLAAKHPEVVKRIETILKTERTPSKLFPIKVLDE
jgi:arylsulfatase A